MPELSDYPPVESPGEFTWYRRGYHQVKNDVVSSFGGHRSWAAARDDAIACMKSRGIDHVWIKGSDGGTDLGVVIWEWERPGRKQP